MIADQCKNLREQLEELKNADDRQKIVEQLEKRREDLATLRDAVRVVTDSLQVLARRTSLVGKVGAATAIERVHRIREALNADPLSITKGRDFTLMNRAFEAFIKEGAAAAKATWDIYMPRARPTPDSNQVAQAEQQKDFVTIANRLKARAKYADTIGKKPPANEEEFVQIEAAWADIRQMISELPQVASDPKVQEFLQAANSQEGASLGLLTDEVHKWLHENNITEKYRITTLWK